MKLLVENKEVPLSDAVLVESIEQYFSFIRITAPGDILNDECTLEVANKEMKLHVVRVDYNNEGFDYTCITEEQYVKLNSSVQPFCGEANVQGLLQNVGMKGFVDGHTDVTFWMVPRMRTISLIKYLNKYSSFSNGGGARAYLDIYGNVHVVDLLTCFSKDVQKISVQVITDHKSSEWFTKVPGKFHIVSFNGLDVTEQDMVLDNRGDGTLSVVDTTGYLTKQKIQQAINEYYFNRFTSRKISATCGMSGVYAIGTCVNLNSTGKYVVSGVQHTLNENIAPNTIQTFVSDKV